MTIEDACKMLMPSKVNKNIPEASLINNPPKLMGKAEAIVIKGTARTKICKE